MTTRTLASIQDIHVDASPGGRLDETIHVMEQAAHEMAEREVDAIAVAGDVFEHTRPSIAEINAVVHVGQVLARVAPVVVVKGNHDGHGALRVLSKLHTKHPIVVEEGYGVHVVGGIALACAAWSTKATLLAESGVRSDRDANRVLLDAFRAQMDRLGDELAQHAGPRALVAHAMVSGSKTSAGQPLVGCELEVALEDLRRARAPITILGHVHKPQSWPPHETAMVEHMAGTWRAALDGNVVYGGSPRSTDFGDLDEKSFLLVGWEDEREPCPSFWRRIPTVAIPLRAAAATWDGTALTLAGDPADFAGSEVRVAYSFPALDGPKARPRAAQLAAELKAAGAIDVSFAPSLVATTEARAPQVAKARTVSDKLIAYWDLHGAPANMTRILGRLDVLGIAQTSRPRGGWIRYRSVKAKGIRPFKGEASLDLTSLPGRIYAVTGVNGAGKSTLLEWLPTVLPGRKMRTHGLVSKAVVSPDAYLEVTFDCDAGQALTMRHTFGKKNDKVTLLGADMQPFKNAAGEPVTPSSMPSEYDAWARENLPHEATYFASSFLAQEQDDFIKLGDTARQGVLLRIAGCEYLEGIAKQCGERSRAVAIECRKLEGAVDELRRRLRLPELFTVDKKGGAGPSSAPLALTLVDREALARAAVAEATKVVAAASVAYQDADVAAGILAQRADAVARMQRVEAAIAEVAARGAELDALLSQAEQIRAAVAQVEALKLDEATAQAEVQRREAERAARAAAADVLDAQVSGLAAGREAVNAQRAARRKVIEAEVAKLTASVGEVDRKIEEIGVLLGRAVQIREAASEKARLDIAIAEAREAYALARTTDATVKGETARAQQAWKAAGAAEQRLASEHGRAVGRKNALSPVTTWTLADAFDERAARAARAGSAVEQAEGELADMRRLAGATMEARAVALRGSVDEISKPGANSNDAWSIAWNAAVDDDNRIALAAGTEMLTAKEADLESLRKAHREALTALAESERARAQLPAIEEAERVELAAQEAHAAAVVDVSETRRALDLAISGGEVSAQALAEALALGTGLKAQLDAVAAEAALAPTLDGAETRTRDLDWERTGYAGALDRLHEEAVGLVEAGPSDDELALRAQVTEARADVEARAAGISEARERRAALAAEQADLAPIVAKAEGLARAEASKVEIERQRADLDADRATIEAEIATLPTEFPGPVLDRETAQAALDVARQDLAAAEHACRGVVEDLCALAQREEERDRLLEEVEDWAKLCEALGRTGVQSDEIDAIGPEVAALATMFLHKCYSPGWTVAEIDTVGGCDVKVLIASDEESVARSTWTLSPGQRAIAGAALTWALNTLSLRRAEAVGATMVLDEVGVALSADNALAWMRMLRMAVEINGVAKLLFISHDPNVVALADGRVHVENGRVEVQ